MRNWIDTETWFNTILIGYQVQYRSTNQKHLHITTSELVKDVYFYEDSLITLKRKHNLIVF